MLLKLHDKVYDIPNTPNMVVEMEAKINEVLESSGLYFGHLIIDDEEVYQDYEEYIQERAQAINQISVKLYTSEELRAEVYIEASNYLNRALPEVKRLSKMFFNKPIQETWMQFEQLTEGLQWLQRMLSGSHSQLLEAHLHEMEQFLPSIEAAIEDRDHSLLSDQLEYEVYPFMQKLLEAVRNSIDNEVVRYDLN